MSGAKLFKWLCFREVSEWFLQEHMDFILSGKKKDPHLSLKTEYEHFLEGKAHMNQSGTPAVTRPQTFTS